MLSMKTQYQPCPIIFLFCKEDSGAIVHAAQPPFYRMFFPKISYRERKERSGADTMADLKLGST
jgi:hypothetical protein